MRFRFLAFCLIVLLASAITRLHAAATEPLFDWSLWEKYRDSVAHPNVVFKPADVQRARENIQRYAWARTYVASVEKNAAAYVDRLTPAFLAAMIPETTPGDPKFTPCPACRDQGKPVHPHGLFSWSASAPDQLTCDMCGTVFPNAKYPENIVVTTQWRKPQTLTYYDGEPFVIFSYRTGRPSFSANIRARKVGHMAGVCRTMAEAYLLTGKIEYARGVRALLLRFAACYPTWLVHTGYGEYADMDPHVAAQFITQLPEPEICPPPNKPDRQLHTGYWTAGRAAATGQESGFVRRMVESYDFTCSAREQNGSALYSDEERRTIERDLLLESTVLLVADKQINNKSVGNRTAAALVGLCVGHPALVRFGYEGFERTVNEWFLPDGTTSESPAYGTMTLGGIWDLPQALRGYSDPAGYCDEQGRRMDATDLYRMPRYAQVWARSFDGLQGDLRYPPFADSYRHSSLGPNFVELMAANYPERPEYLALLKETCGTDLARGHAALALYYREPGLEQKSVPPLALPSWCSPDLRIGHLRTGADGRESLLLLSASRWGGHHHLDSLNLYYWKNGGEVLSDLGYLWDHPRKSQTTRTVAHNTVLIDEKDQVTRERGGEVEFFRVADHVKVMEASSRAYPDAKLYRRTTALIDHGGGKNYVVDFFRVQGGARQDYVFHGATKTCTVVDATLAPARGTSLFDFTNVREVSGGAAWCITWTSESNQTCVAWNLSQPNERAFVADGWGQRDWKNSDIGATIPYIVRRHEGDAAVTFMSVFEAHHPGTPFVRNVRVVDGSGELAIETADGIDHVLSSRAAATLNVETGAARASLTGRFAVASIRNGTVAWTFVEPAGDR